MWISDLILIFSVTNKMELEDILSAKNLTDFYALKEFGRDYLYNCKKIITSIKFAFVTRDRLHLKNSR